jgi:large subunit ribosomal protein L17
MLHRVAGRKLSRTKNQRTALFKGLASSLILHERITTTEAKAKAVKPIVEKLVTRAKEESIHSRRMLLKKLGSENVVNKLLEVVGPKFKDRPGGYLRIVKIGGRSGDQAPMVSLMFVEDFSSIALQKEATAAKTKIEKPEKEVKKTKTAKKATKVAKKETK